MADTTAHPDTKDLTVVTGLVPVTALPSLERMRAMRDHQRAFRQLLLEYVKSEMDETRHFYTVGDTAKPALSQDGARKLCGLYEVRVGDSTLTETYHDDGHYSCKSTVRLYSMATGDEVAQGTGSCTTRESRYAYRWMFPNQVPSNIPKADLVSREITTRNGRSTQYRVPNPDLADQYNTVLKMAEKRAQTAAVLRLPEAAEIFGEAEEPENASDEARKELLSQLGKWMRTLKADVRAKAVLAIFRTPHTTAEIQKLSEDELAMALAVIDRAEAAKVSWQSPTLVADLHKVLQTSADKAKSDLFPEGPATTSTPAAPLKGKPAFVTEMEKAQQETSQVEPATWRDVLAYHLEALPAGKLKADCRIALNDAHFSERVGNELATEMLGVIAGQEAASMERMEQAQGDTHQEELI
jgi:hypothetical protein